MGGAGAAAVALSQSDVVAVSLPTEGLDACEVWRASPNACMSYVILRSLPSYIPGSILISYLSHFYLCSSNSPLHIRLSLLPLT